MHLIVFTILLVAIILLLLLVLIIYVPLAFVAPQLLQLIHLVNDDRRCTK